MIPRSQNCFRGQSLVLYKKYPSEGSFLQTDSLFHWTNPGNEADYAPVLTYRLVAINGFSTSIKKPSASAHESIADLRISKFWIAEGVIKNGYPIHCK